MLAISNNNRLILNHKDIKKTPQDVFALYIIIYRKIHLRHHPKVGIYFHYACSDGILRLMPCGDQLLEFNLLEPFNDMRLKKNKSRVYTQMCIGTYHKLIQLEKRERDAERMTRNRKHEGLRDEEEMRGRRAKGKVVKVVGAVSLQILQVACCG